MKDLVEKYIKLRDIKTKVRQKYLADVSKVDAVLEKIEARLLKEFEKSGLESIRTEDGTAYKAVRSQASVADWDAVLRFIQTEGMWSMLERRVSKDAVAAYRDANDDLPPGVNWREEVTVNVRRS